MNGNAPRRMADVRLGKDACFDAWLYNLFIDNNLVHDLNPHIVASPEQLKFMVAGGPGSVYRTPCSPCCASRPCPDGCKKSTIVPGASSCALCGPS